MQQLLVVAKKVAAEANVKDAVTAKVTAEANAKDAVAAAAEATAVTNSTKNHTQYLLN
jgi:hypothetical protein